MTMINCLFVLSVTISGVQGCEKAPIWLFSLPTDLKDIYMGLSGRDERA